MLNQYNIKIAAITVILTIIVITVIITTVNVINSSQMMLELIL